jgi:hypothetical protein
MVPRSLKARRIILISGSHDETCWLYRLVDQDRAIYLGVNRSSSRPDRGLCGGAQEYLPSATLIGGTLEPRKNFNTLLHVLLRLQKMD